MEDDDALTHLCHLLGDTQALGHQIGVRLRQVHDATLVVAAPKELLAQLECSFMLGEAAKCGAALFARGDDGGASAEKADDAHGAAVHRGDEQRSEPTGGVYSIRVRGALLQQAVDLRRVATRGRVV